MFNWNAGHGEGGGEATKKDKSGSFIRKLKKKFFFKKSLKKAVLMSQLEECEEYERSMEDVGFCADYCGGNTSGQKYSEACRVADDILRAKAKSCINIGGRFVPKMQFALIILMCVILISAVPVSARIVQIKTISENNDDYIRLIFENIIDVEQRPVYRGEIEVMKEWLKERYGQEFVIDECWTNTGGMAYYSIGLECKELDNYVSYEVYAPEGLGIRLDMEGVPKEKIKVCGYAGVSYLKDRRTIIWTDERFVYFLSIYEDDLGVALELAEKLYNMQKK